jgi:hypothetical protein
MNSCQLVIPRAARAVLPTCGGPPVPPSTSIDVASITALAEAQLAAATTAESGRSSVTVYGRCGARLRQTIVALAGGG